MSAFLAGHLQRHPSTCARHSIAATLERPYSSLGSVSCHDRSLVIPLGSVGGLQPSLQSPESTLRYTLCGDSVVFVILGQFNLHDHIHAKINGSRSPRRLANLSIAQSGPPQNSNQGVGPAQRFDTPLFGFNFRLPYRTWHRWRRLSEASQRELQHHIRPVHYTALRTWKAAKYSKTIRDFA